MRHHFVVGLFLIGFRDHIDIPRRVIVALQSPTGYKATLSVQGNSRGSFFGKLVSFVLEVHVLFAKMTGVVVHETAVVLEEFREQADLNLFFKTGGAVAIHEDALFVDVSVQVETEPD